MKNTAAAIRQSREPVSYSLCLHLKHMAQELADALKWHERAFQNDRERDAYRAGFEQGAGKARVMISLHGNYYLND